jgi:hypothetical protein
VVSSVGSAVLAVAVVRMLVLMLVIVVLMSVVPLLVVLVLVVLVLVAGLVVLMGLATLGSEVGLDVNGSLVSPQHHVTPAACVVRHTQKSSYRTEGQPLPFASTIIRSALKPPAVGFQSWYPGWSSSG